MDYTVIDGHPDYMYHLARAMRYETYCEGCGMEYTAYRTPQTGRGGIVAVITDRSGSEQASAHNDPDCIAVAVAGL